jgi:catechol 2,3-dioxygenase-like lactoylglutathione lyase family enzyme
MAQFPGLAHVAVTVNDLSISRPWYEKLFDAKAVLDEDTGIFHHVVWMLDGGTLFGIHTHPKMDSGDAFSELRPGLDHVGFGVANRAALEEWEKKLDGLGIKHGGIVDAPYGSGLSFRDPDNIALELFAPPG